MINDWDRCNGVCGRPSIALRTGGSVPTPTLAAYLYSGRGCLNGSGSGGHLLVHQVPEFLLLDVQAPGEELLSRDSQRWN